MTGGVYQGGELEVFQHATNWKRYYASLIAPSILGRVLEVGAGIGSTTRILCDGRQSSWTCLEPHPTLAARLAEMLASHPLPVPSQVVRGTLADLTEGTFDTLLYIDVLEHIENDRAELTRAASVLARQGRLIVLSPAHTWLFSPFDRANGHWRRYTRSTLLARAPSNLTLVTAFYLDSVGMVASTANRLFLRSATPTLHQVRFWDSTLIPASRMLDRVFLRRLGKTVVAIWAKSPKATA